MGDVEQVAVELDVVDDYQNQVELLVVEFLAELQPELLVIAFFFVELGVELAFDQVPAPNLQLGLVLAELLRQQALSELDK